MKKILIADDDRTARLLLVEAAKAEGLITIEASDGRVAREILFDNPDIAAVVTDMMMPNESGRDLVTLLRSSPLFKDLPVIMVSGVVKLSEISDILELGASRFLPKPINVTHFRDYLRAIFRARQSDSAAAH